MRFIVALIIAVQIIRHLVEIAALAERRRGGVIARKGIVRDRWAQTRFLGRPYISSSRPR